MTCHLVYAFEISPPAFLPTIFALWMPAILHHTLEVAHLNFGGSFK